MKIEKRMLTILVISILLLSTFAALSKNLIPKVNAQDGAELTGNIYDKGIDTDADGLFNSLQIGVEVNVTDPATYQVYVSTLYGTVWIYVSNYIDVFLNPGIQTVNVSFNGAKIYASYGNVSAVYSVELSVYEGYYYNTIEYKYNLPLNRTYSYTEFDPYAFLTGRILDKGIDTDADGLFNSLQIGVEVNVTDPATYQVYVSNPYGTVWIYITSNTQVFLNPGIQTINVSLDGARILASHGNISTVQSIELVVYDGYNSYTIGYISNQPLNRTYNYKEFDPLAFFTGKILDEGIDEDQNGLYDYLKISIEINVTDTGYYRITVDDLYGNNSDSVYFQMSGIGQSFDVGVHLVNFTVYGPRIYGEHIDPTYVGPVRLYEYSPWEDILLEQNPKMRLSVPYHYYEFESHAFLTGKIYDSVADTDADGLQDYLKVGVEINVTEAGVYQISIGGLAEKLNGTFIGFGYSQYSVDNFSVGIHIINFTFSGPLIASYYFNPTNASGLGLVETSTGFQLSYVDMAPLSRRYNWTEFDPPLNDVQLEFTVYPNATVGVSGLFNYTNAFYDRYNRPPFVNATMGFSTIGNLTTGSANGTVVLPENLYFYPYYLSSHEFPLNSTTMNYASQYNNGMLNANLNATMQLPPEGQTTYPFNSSNLSLHGAYSNGMLNINLYGETTLPSFIASMFPLNITDVTVMAAYDGNELNGNVTFHALSGFPLGDVIVNFSGNQTEITFTGYADVIYGNWFGMELNQTTLEEMLSAYNSTIPGRGAGSLYNMTMDMVECTRLNTTMTPFTNPLVGATVNYTATIRGNFTQLLAYMIIGPYASNETRSLIDAAINVTVSSIDHASLKFDYYHDLKMGFLNLTLTDNVKALWSNALQIIPAKIPTEYSEYRNQTEAFLKIANITADAVENANLDLGYSSDTQQVTIHASLTANVTKMKNEIIPILSGAVPSQYKDFVESCTNTTYCTLDSLNTTCNYANGVIDFDAKWLLDGDFTAELNRIKSCYFQYLNLTSPWMLNWQMLLLNATEIDLSNFKAELREGEVRLGEYWMTFQFEGAKVHRVEDEIDPIRFKLYRLFNLTSDPYESPREFEKLKLTIIGGSNATQTVLLYAPTTVLNPDNTSLDYKVMIWQNTSLSSLRDLRFHIAYQQVIHYLGSDYYVPIFTNSTLSNFNYDFSNTNAPSISFNVSGTAGMGFCNITIPRALLDATMGNWTINIDGSTLPLENYTVTENSAYAFIFFNYTHSSHSIEVVGTWLVSEFPQNMYLPILMILSFIAAVIAIKQRKRLGKVKAKYQGAIQAFAKILNQLRT